MIDHLARIDALEACIKDLRLLCGQLVEAVIELDEQHKGATMNLLHIVAPHN